MGFNFEVFFNNAIPVFFGISLLSSWSCRNSAFEMMSTLGVDTQRYPKRYIKPARWVRKLFNIKQRVVPRYLYFQLFLSLFYAALFPINLIICIVANCAPNVAGILVMFHVGLILVNEVSFIIISFFMQRK